jgi:hypothetical protein
LNSRRERDVVQRVKPQLVAWVVLGAALALPGWAQEHVGAWATVVKGPITVRNRAIVGTAIREIWAEGEIAAPALDVQEALMNVARLRTFMPYLKDAHVIGQPLEDGSWYVYTLIDLPVIGKRDYIVRLELKQSLAPDGTGIFRNEWHAYPTLLPLRSGVPRVMRNDGSWVVTPLGDGSRSWAVYKFLVDPGGWVPAFAANLGNEHGVKETYAAVAKESARLRDERLAAARKLAAENAPAAPAQRDQDGGS